MVNLRTFSLVLVIFLIANSSLAADQIVTDGNLVLNGSTYSSHSVILSRGALPPIPATDADGAIFCEWNGFNGNDECVTLRHGALKFQTRSIPGSTVNYVTAMLINRSGFVGIGTASPANRLHISQAQGSIARFQSPENGLVIISDDNTPSLTNSTNTVTINATRMGTGTYPKLRLAGQGGIEFASDANSVRAVLNSTGFGIGTNNPQVPLHVAGNALVGGVPSTTSLYNGFFGQNTANLEIGSSLPTNTNNQFGTLILSNNQTGPSSIVGAIQFGNRALTGAEKRTAFISNFTDGDISSGNLIFGVANSGTLNEAVRINKDGNVGIGTSSPTAKLTVIGTISAKEVKVTANGFPDYVFDNSYKLRSLDEVDNYIKKNNRLPGIPSAVEIERDGLNLSEISKKQMEKIEEITLYLIQMKKELDSLKQENVELRAQLKKQ